MTKDLINKILEKVSILMLPFVFVYFLIEELLKKAVKYTVYILLTLQFFYFGSIILLVLLGEGQKAVNDLVGMAGDTKRFFFVDLPKDAPVKIKMVITYIKAHPLVKNLLFMYLIGFVWMRFADLMKHLFDMKPVKKVEKTDTNTNTNIEKHDDSGQYTYDPTGGFTQAHFQVYFPEGWQERRRQFFEQMEQVKKEKEKIKQEKAK